MLKSFTTYGLDKITAVTQSASQSGAQDVKNSNMQVGISAPVTPVVTLKATYSTGKYTLGSSLGGAGYGVERNQSGYQLGANYALSKRTDLYAAYGTFTRQNTTATGNNTDTGYAMGVRHTF
jgi:predicted porin